MIWNNLYKVRSKTNDWNPSKTKQSAQTGQPNSAKVTYESRTLVFIL